MTSTPYLSVVATARNDNHGGDLLRRMQTFVNALAAQCERHRVDAELLLVEWNPPSDRPRLTEALRWPTGNRFSVRVIEVPPALHARVEHADRLPLFQMLAKNVGIRRARGEFVLATNVDLLFSDELMRFIAAGDLAPDTVYRTDRHDVDLEFDPELPVDELLLAAAANTIRVCGRDGTRDARTGAYYRIYRRVPALPFLSVAATIAAQIRFVVVRTLAFFAGRRARHHYRSALRRVTRQPPLPPLPPVVKDPNGQGRFGLLGHDIRRSWRYQRAVVRLHTNGCGDFTLMARRSWEALRGYPELHVFSMHLDSLLLYVAHYSRFREVYVPAPLYHLEHLHGFRPDEESVRSLNDRVESARIPQITIEQFLDWADEMRRNHAPIEFNDPEWGFAGEQLPEWTPSRETMAASA